MSTQKFPKESLINLVCEGGEDGYEIVHTEMVDTSRWSIQYEMVFKFEDKFFISDYSVGSTESQDESPYEYEDNEIECVEVAATEKTVIVYEPV